MRKLLLTITLALPFFLSAVPTATTQGIPVIDTAQIAQVIATLQQQIRDFDEQVRHFEKMQEQLTNMQDRLTAMTGPKGISSILNDATSKLQRTAAADFSSILDGAISGAGVTGNVGNLNAIMNDLRDRFELSDIGDFDGSDIAQDRAIASLAGAGLASVGTAENTYQRSNEAVTRIDTLLDGIDGNADLKASIDYNTRMQGEVAQLLVEMLRVNAVAANNQGLMALTQARNEAAQRKFLKAGE